MFYSRHTREGGNGAAWRAGRKTRVTRGGQAPQRLPLPGQALGDGPRCVWCIAVKGHSLALWRAPSGPLGRVAARGSRGGSRKEATGSRKEAERKQAGQDHRGCGGRLNRNGRTRPPWRASADQAGKRQDRGGLNRNSPNSARREGFSRWAGLKGAISIVMALRTISAENVRSCRGSQAWRGVGFSGP